MSELLFFKKQYVCKLACIRILYKISHLVIVRTLRKNKQNIVCWNECAELHTYGENGKLFMVRVYSLCNIFTLHIGSRSGSCWRDKTSRSERLNSGNQCNRDLATVKQVQIAGFWQHSKYQNKWTSFWDVFLKLGSKECHLMLLLLLSRIQALRDCFFWDAYAKTSTVYFQSALSGSARVLMKALV